MHVHKTRRNDASGQVLHRHAAMLGGKRTPTANRLHHLQPLGVGADDQQAVLFVPDAVGAPRRVSKPQQAGAVAP